MKPNRYIPVTKPFMPPLAEFMPYLERIWGSAQLTNNGEVHQELECALSNYLNVEHLSLCSSGTIGLLLALKSLKLTGEIITTPYTFVATSHSLLWNNLTPVFIDIDPTTFNIDPHKIEAAITSKTSAILGVHCYGNPCDTIAIQLIASKYGLKVIYDAAHAFGVKTPSGSILNEGHISVLSLHATKAFTTLEGGAIISSSVEEKRKINTLKNFGIITETEVTNVGINGKMNEVQAAFGLLQLQYADYMLKRRKEIDRLYRILLCDLEHIKCVDQNPEITYNHSYFPILFNKNCPVERDEIYDELKKNNVLSRRYFYPLVSNYEMYKNIETANPRRLPIANRIANQILCLPIYPQLTDSEVEFIAMVIRKKYHGRQQM